MASLILVPHSVTFNGKNSFSDWHLVPDGRPVIAMPEVNKTIVEVPGASEVYDFSEYLTGYPTYKNRTGDMAFHVLNDYGDWQQRYGEIANHIHGKRIRVSLEDDPTHYYMGRVSIGSWTSNNDGTWSDISFSYDLDPYRYRNTDIVLTQTLNGESYARFALNTSNIGRMPTIPKFTATNNGNSSGISIRLTNPELSLTASESINGNRTLSFPNMVLSNISGTNVNILEARGYATLKVTIKNGDL